jgi:hypothetical protein
MTMPKVHLPTFVTLLVLVLVILAIYHFAHKH